LLNAEAVVIDQELVWKIGEVREEIEQCVARHAAIMTAIVAELLNGLYPDTDSWR
jgi:hypothetical protein